MPVILAVDRKAGHRGVPFLVPSPCQAARRQQESPSEGAWAMPAKPQAGGELLQLIGWLLEDEGR